MMNIRLILPTHADFNAHCEAMKSAFVGSDDPKTEFLNMVSMIERKDASFYQIADMRGKCRFVGYVNDSGVYHIVALSGRHLLKVAPSIINLVKAAGYTGIQFHTYKNGMRRILRGIGFECVETVRESAAITETIHRLEF